MNVIVLSAYNGQTYLKKQIDSLLTQTVQDFVLLIRDDGSQDGTAQVVTEYTDPRIRLIPGENIGITPSFCCLMKQAAEMGAEHLFFCDQDDIWHPDKLEQFLNAFACPRDVPELVFSDFRMIDENDTVTGDSFAAFAGLRIPENGDFFPKLLAQPYVFGCACGVNRALLELVTDIPPQAEMYDCWIAMTAALTGVVRYLPQATIGHRFHSSNATGRAGQNSLISRVKRLTADFGKQRENTRCRLAQIPLLRTAHRDRLLPKEAVRLAELEAALHKNNFALLSALRRHGVSRGGSMQNLFFYLTVLTQKRRT